MVMTKDEFAEHHRAALVSAHNIFTAKNEDYSPGNDPFGNFRLAGVILEDFLKPEYKEFAPMLGLMIRNMDKIQRQRAFMLQGLKVDGESIHDACLDPVNYAIILDGLFTEYLASQE